MEAAEDRCYVSRAWLYGPHPYAWFFTLHNKNTAPSSRRQKAVLLTVVKPSGENETLAIWETKKNDEDGGNRRSESGDEEESSSSYGKNEDDEEKEETATVIVTVLASDLCPRVCSRSSKRS